MIGAKVWLGEPPVLLGKARGRRQRQSPARHDGVEDDGDRSGDLMAASGEGWVKDRYTHGIILFLGVGLSERGTGAGGHVYGITSRGLLDCILQICR